ncbi:neuronal acetylcholine receptor subunit alpha-3-like, partial [Saccostrea cucullata]|uniref:neuronal acetylcholine receptor subunit alpha-3-like n=1 Tax=Saccostrea cuccullata TaxID=36930 RepID=UPI002ED693A7
LDLCVAAFTTTRASDIHAEIFNSSYNYLVRPSDLTSVNMEFVIFAVNQVDLKNQVISLSGWLTVKWQDDRLVWNPSSYGDIDLIYTKPAKIWKPELIIDNSVSGMDPIGHDDLLFRVKNTGEIRWDPPGLYDVHCEIDITYFPFDYQTCYIEVASWVYSMEKVNLTKIHDYVLTEDYHVNGEWDLDSTFVKESFLTEEGEMFSSIKFALVLKRRAGYYMSHIIFPVLIISLLTNITFLLPADSGEKISFILTVLLSLAVLLTLIGDSMPTTSLHTSILAVYLSLVLAVSGVVILLTVLNLRLYLRVDQKNIPNWLKRFTIRVLIPFSCQCSKVKDSSKVEVIRQNTNMVQVTDLDHADVVTVENGQKKKKTLKRMSQKKAEIPEQDFPSSEIDDDFPYLCRDISGFLDCFFFHLFNVIIIVLTGIFLAILLFGSKPHTSH